MQRAVRIIVLENDRLRALLICTGISRANKSNTFYSLSAHRRIDYELVAIKSPSDRHSRLTQTHPPGGVSRLALNFLAREAKIGAYMRIQLGAKRYRG